MTRQFIVAAFALLMSVSLNAKDILAIDSPKLGCVDSIEVYSPVILNGVRELPTLFLLHGYGGDYANWGRRKDLQDLSDRTGFRIICPDGFKASWYTDNSDPSKMQWRTFFWDELWPLIEAKYGLNPDRTFISGLSMGGFGSMNIFLDKPELFRAGASMSGVLEITDEATSLRRVIPFDSANDPVAVSNNPMRRLDRAAGLGKTIIITCGTEDPYYNTAVAFSARCHELKIRTITMFSPGNHNWNFWRMSVEDQISWFTKIIKGEI